MIRNSQSLMLAALAALTLCAGSAAASGEKFHVGQEHTILSAESTTSHVLSAPWGTWTCTKVLWDATTTEVTPGAITATDITYTGCTTKTIFGTINVTIDFKGCDYVFTADTTQPTHMACPAGSGPITVTGPGCTITFAPQTVNGTTYSNSGSHITVNTSISNITSTSTGFFCSSTGISTTGTYKGTTTIKGAWTDGAAVAVSYG